MRADTSSLFTKHFKPLLRPALLSHTPPPFPPMDFDRWMTADQLPSALSCIKKYKEGQQTEREEQLSELQEKAQKNLFVQLFYRASLRKLTDEWSRSIEQVTQTIDAGVADSLKKPLASRQAAFKQEGIKIQAQTDRMVSEHESMASYLPNPYESQFMLDAARLDQEVSKAQVRKRQLKEKLELLQNVAAISGQDGVPSAIIQAIPKSWLVEGGEDNAHIHQAIQQTKHELKEACANIIRFGLRRHWKNKEWLSEQENAYGSRPMRYPIMDDKGNITGLEEVGVVIGTGLNSQVFPPTTALREVEADEKIGGSFKLLTHKSPDDLPLDRRRWVKLTAKNNSNSDFEREHLIKRCRDNKDIKQQVLEYINTLKLSNHGKYLTLAEIRTYIHKDLKEPRVAEFLGNILDVNEGAALRKGAALWKSIEEANITQSNREELKTLYEALLPHYNKPSEIPIRPQERVSEAAWYSRQAETDLFTWVEKGKKPYLSTKDFEDANNLLHKLHSVNGYSGDIKEDNYLVERDDLGNIRLLFTDRDSWININNLYAKTRDRLYPLICTAGSSLPEWEKTNYLGNQGQKIGVLRNHWKHCDWFAQLLVMMSATTGGWVIRPSCFKSPEKYLRAGASMPKDAAVASRVNDIIINNYEKWKEQKKNPVNPVKLDQSLFGQHYRQWQRNAEAWVEFYVKNEHKPEVKSLLFKPIAEHAKDYPNHSTSLMGKFISKSDADVTAFINKLRLSANLEDQMGQNGASEEEIEQQLRQYLGINL